LFALLQSLQYFSNSSACAVPVRRLFTVCRRNKLIIFYYLICIIGFSSLFLKKKYSHAVEDYFWRSNYLLLCLFIKVDHAGYISAKIIKQNRGLDRRYTIEYKKIV